MYKFSNVLATWFGTGLAAKAPGTIGSTGTIPLVILISYFFDYWALLFAAAILFVVGVWATKEVLKDTTEDDPSEVVIDETVGMLLTFIFVTQYLDHTLKNWWIYLVGFLIFRFFDIYKFGIVKYFDNKKNAWGVMLDDVFAGLRASVVLFVICYLVFEYQF